VHHGGDLFDGDRRVLAARGAARALGDEALQEFVLIALS
jgi:hypothetical protein